MPSYSRELTVLAVLGAALWLPNCSQLTKVDWSLIPPAGGSTSGGMGGEAGEITGAAGDETLAGEGGMSGEAGTAGESSAGEAGDDGSGGARAGSGGLGGSGGGGGQDSGVSGGGSGGAPVVHQTCTEAPSPPSPLPDLTNALVIFDGGAGGNGNRGGRKGLDEACKGAKQQLALPQTDAAAIISLSLLDQIVDMPEHYHFPRSAPHVVSRLGIEFASSWDNVWALPGTPTSLVCAGVMAPNVPYWLTGSGNSKGGPDQLSPLFGVYESAGDLAGNEYSHACNEWSFADHDPDIVARVGSTTAMLDGGLDGFPYFIRTPVLVSCDGASDHVLCLAFNRVP